MADYTALFGRMDISLGEGAGEAVDVDAEGRLVVRTDAGEQHVFTGEVSVHGIYGVV